MTLDEARELARARAPAPFETNQAILVAVLAILDFLVSSSASKAEPDATENDEKPSGRKVKR